MNTSTIIYDCNAPPPTFNTLDSHQRSRLIRSTRKLGAVLGSTPQLIESDSPLSPPRSSSVVPHPPAAPARDRKRRQGSIFEFAAIPSAFLHDYASSSASSSSSSLPRGSLDSNASDMSTQSLPMPKSFARHVRDKSRSKGKRTPLPTPLVLRLNAVPLPPTDPRVQPDSPDMLKTATLAAPAPSALPITPTTPLTPATPTATETRRKRLAKLKRTLGENVPPELIAPIRTIRAHLSSPVDPPPAPMTMSPPPAPFRSARSHAKPYATVRSSIRPEKPNPLPVHAVSSRKRSLSVDYKHGVLSPALMSATPHPPPPPPPNTQSIHSRLHTRSPSYVSEFPLSPQTSRVTEERSSRVWVTGATTWIGEWNRKDIREVQHQLRSLKAR
ncbi:hypothetical protein C8Q80DRAFT_1211301 [Daedaleopsis nitida]|nr:hypothetical protein C8Q80DRAFT_1211301 [Daedaleopsis nitida]